MAFWGRAHLIKASLLAGFLLLLLNVYNYLLDTRLHNIPTVSSLTHTSYAQWPKRTRSSLEMARFLVNHTNPDRHNHSAQLQFQLQQRNQQPKQSFPSSINSSQSHLSAQLSVINNASANFEDPLPAATATAAGATRSSLLHTIMTTLGMRECPAIPPNLLGAINVNTTIEPLVQLERRLGAGLLPGGWHRPADCAARERVAIVVPYRDRPDHLPVFLANLHPLLQKQQIEYGMFVVEQVAEGLFNRAALMNVGFVEAMKLAAWDCFIFHDIDLLPLDDRNLYSCPDQPRHMSVAVDTMGFKLPYSSIFGGVSALTVEQFRRVNGFSNSFWGWGGEDDDMSNRLRHCGYHIARYPVNIARYMMLNHKKEKANPKRYENLVSGAKKFDVEGLNSLQYEVKRLEKRVLYTWIQAEIKPDTSS